MADQGAGVLIVPVTCAGWHFATVYESMMWKTFVRIFPGFAFLLGCAGAACAGNFSVSPVRVSLDEGQRVGSLVLRNLADQPVVVQLELMKWTQSGGKDAYEPTRDLVMSPPVFTVPAGGQQVIRIGQRGAIPAGAELAYRLFLREVPPPPDPGQQGLQMALNVSLPVFVSGKATIVRALDWKAGRDEEGRLVIHAVNRSTAHVQVKRLQVSLSDGSSSQGAGNVYLLAGQAHVWTLPVVASPDVRLRLQAITDRGEQKVELGVD